MSAFILYAPCFIIRNNNKTLIQINIHTRHYAIVNLPS